MKVRIHCCLSGYDASSPSVSSHIPVSVVSRITDWSGCFKNVRCYGGLSVVLLQPWYSKRREGNFFPVLGFYLFNSFHVSFICGYGLSFLKVEYLKIELKEDNVHYTTV